MCIRDSTDGALYEEIAVLSLEGKRLPIFLYDPAARGVAGGLAILLAEDDFAGVFLRLDA